MEDKGLHLTVECVALSNEHRELWTQWFLWGCRGVEAVDEGNNQECQHLVCKKVVKVARWQFGLGLNPVHCMRVEAYLLSWCVYLFFAGIYSNKAGVVQLNQSVCLSRITRNFWKHVDEFVWAKELINFLEMYVHCIPDHGSRKPLDFHQIMDCQWDISEGLWWNVLLG